MAEKRKRTISTAEEKLRWDYNHELFRQVLAQRLLNDGKPIDEVRRRLGNTPDEIDQRVRDLAEALS